VSGRDSQLLVHLDRTQPTTLTALARHMDLSPSTLSEAVARLQQYGYLVKASGNSEDRRQIGITLTRKGVDACWPRRCSSRRGGVTSSAGCRVAIWPRS
jgi:DNA-binding MarR family transcriptional regulator